MNVILYAAMAYALTALISLCVVGIVVGVDRLMKSPEREE